ncbi:unnamed protein product [Rhodiola kirilowii]
MKLFSWNCRGLGRPRTVRALKDAIRAFSPQIVCLLETRKKETEGDWVRRKLGFRNGLLVSCRGQSGGLALLWNEDLEVRIKSFSRNHIDAIVEDQTVFRLTLFYGEPAVSNRMLGWSLLRRLGEDRSFPWLVIGDFNEVVCQSEVQGGRGRQNWQMENFRRVLDDCELTDIGYLGYPFTYSNRREGEAEVRARLDRVVASHDWRSRFPRTAVKHVQLYASDHQLLVLNTDSRCDWRNKRFFRFEMMWFDHPDFTRMMNQFWDETDFMIEDWHCKLRRCKNMLMAWNQASFGNVQRRIKFLKKELEDIRKEDRSLDVVDRERRISDELDQWLVREETLWMQRSRVLWMEHGDRNTKYFHAKASQRRQKNWITQLKDSQGFLQEGEENIMRIVEDYFSNIFRTSISRNVEVLDAELGDVTACITNDMNVNLLREVTEDEIKMAVFSLGPLKAPGIDGFPAVFYQKFWDKIKNSVVREVRRFWVEGSLNERMNRTLIALIPKKKEADRMEDWRPISLCTVAMKIITKILAMRLQLILDQVISPSQSAFIKGRVISDNVVVAHEISHYLKSRNDDKNFYASIKVDMSKAYDRVEWLFLERLLLKLGFADKWVSRVMLCVNSVSYQVKVNNKLSKVIKPERGLRQGDPLSPYLFLFCTELLNFKLQKALANRIISGIQICRKAPIVTHLLFADDSIFFVRAEKEEINCLKNVLRQYEGVSGQRINFEKSEVCFSRNTPADVRWQVCNSFCIRQVPCHSRYLGMPLVVGQRKTEVFKSIVEKIWRKVKDWKSRLLSAAGREVLVKAVIQAMPIYMMSVYHFPKKVIADISMMVQQFWWAKKGSKSISWLSQNILQKKKCEGGIGFKDLGIFNEALLMKIAWRVAKFPHLLMSKVLSAKYCGGGNIMNARLGSNPSHGWRGVMRRMNVFLGAIWWEDNGETCRWRYSSDGVFSVKSAYEVLKVTKSVGVEMMGEQSDMTKIHRFWDRIWGCKIPNKVKVFGWRLFHNALPDAWNLRRRGIIMDGRCKICGYNRESALHVVRDCWWARVVFREMGVDPSSFVRSGNDPADWLWSCLLSSSEEDCRKLLVMAWVCWKNRNRVWHGLDCWNVKVAGLISRSMLAYTDLHFCPRPMDNFNMDGSWIPPDAGCIKINSDGSWDSLARRAGIGIAARDHLGIVLWTWADQEDRCFCASEVEGRALLRGMELANKLKAERAVFEVDSLEVYKAVTMGKGVEEWCSSWLPFVLNCLQVKPSWSVHFIFRNSNQLADYLASKACRLQWKWNVLEAIPFCIANVL